MVVDAALMDGTWRLAIVAATARSIVTLRADLIQDVLASRHRVLCITPPAPERDISALEALGVRHQSVEFNPPGIGFLAKWKAVRALREKFGEWQPHAVLAYGLEEVVNTAIAAKRARVGRVVGVCNGLPNRGIENIGRRRFIAAMRAIDALIFHNSDDRRRLTSQGVLPADLPTLVLPGSGVNLDRYTPRHLPPTDPNLVFLMIGRLNRSRGIFDYAHAARAIRESGKRARFLLAGTEGFGPDAVTPKALEQASGDSVEYLGALDDIRDALASAHVFVYPSYSEGMPRTVLEALASGRPVITTDAPGCRETVDDKVSGCLVPVRDPKALAAAMESFINRPELIAPVGRAARLKAERRFDMRDVHRTLIALTGLPDSKFAASA
jgi:glycosyltransferase involved in cell wall biosynthesis